MVTGETTRVYLDAEISGQPVIGAERFCSFFPLFLRHLQFLVRLKLEMAFVDVELQVQVTVRDYSALEVENQRDYCNLCKNG